MSQVEARGNAEGLDPFRALAADFEPASRPVEKWCLAKPPQQELDQVIDGDPESAGLWKALRQGFLDNFN